MQEESGILRTATPEAIEAFFVRRLGEIFAGVAPNPLMLKNPRNIPIYLLCFAAGNPRGATPAVRIAGHLLGHATINATAWLPAVLLAGSPSALVGPLPIGVVGSLGFAAAALWILSRWSGEEIPAARQGVAPADATGRSRARTG